MVYYLHSIHVYNPDLIDIPKNKNMTRESFNQFHFDYISAENVWIRAADAATIVDVPETKYIVLMQSANHHLWSI